jgi:hypothetical protein
MPEPIGSIIAYGGVIITPQWEADPNNDGWLPCDGRELDTTGLYSALFVAIGFAWGGDPKRRKFNLPNLQGYFLRGVDPSRDQLVDKDSDARFAGHPGGNRGAKVGSFQGYATALPPPVPIGQQDTSFRTNVAGDHKHLLQFELNAGRDVDDQDNTVAYPGGPETDEPMRLAGAHEHVIIGGNKETRPVNAYVHWIIKYR